MDHYSRVASHSWYPFFQQYCIAMANPRVKPRHATPMKVVRWLAVLFIWFDVVLMVAGRVCLSLRKYNMAMLVPPFTLLM